MYQTNKWLRQHRNMCTTSGASFMGRISLFVIISVGRTKALPLNWPDALITRLVPVLRGNGADRLSDNLLYNATLYPAKRAQFRPFLEKRRTHNKNSPVPNFYFNNSTFLLHPHTGICGVRFRAISAEQKYYLLVHSFFYLIFFFASHLTTSIPACVRPKSHKESASSEPFGHFCRQTVK